MPQRRILAGNPAPHDLQEHLQIPLQADCQRPGPLDPIRSRRALCYSLVFQRGVSNEELWRSHAHLSSSATGRPPLGCILAYKLVLGILDVMKTGQRKASVAARRAINSLSSMCFCCSDNDASMD
jgi:hypothetical protein